MQTYLTFLFSNSGACDLVPQGDHPPLPHHRATRQEGRHPQEARKIRQNLRLQRRQAGHAGSSDLPARPGGAPGQAGGGRQADETRRRLCGGHARGAGPPQGLEGKRLSHILSLKAAEDNKV